jgi:hypothetical protein
MLEQESTEIRVVDLDYEIHSDETKNAVHLKFTNFEDVDQMEKFKKYMIDHLPLLLFTSDKRH